MEDSIISILIYAFTALFVYTTVKYILNQILHQEVKSHIKQVLADMVHEVRVEMHGTMQYWFDSDSNIFLGQGQTDLEIIENVKARFPTHIFIVPDKGLLARPDWIFKNEISEIINVDRS
jgi:hypothetical protein